MTDLGSAAMPAGRSAEPPPVGELLCVGFEGESAPPGLLGRIRHRQVGGVILFRRNLVSLEQTAALLAEIAEAAADGLPLFIGVDQEGGRVQRLPTPATIWPAAAKLAAAGDPALTYRVATALGNELRVLGFNLDFAPVLDVHTNPANPVIGDRAFARLPEEVASHGVAFMHGLADAGIAPCGKHFPGHGDTFEDSHLTLPVCELPRERLLRLELWPFAAAVREGLAMVMTAHVVYTALDPNHPATLSPGVLRLLRERLCFSGVIVSDDLEMRAIADQHPPGEAAVAAIEAGVDLLLLCRLESLQLAAHDALRREAERSPAFRERVLESVRRLHLVRQRLPSSRRPDPAEVRRWVGCVEHASLTSSVTRLSRLA